MFCCFLLFPVGEKWFSSFERIPLGIFRRCEIDEILTIVSFWKVLGKWADSFTLGSPYDIVNLDFSSKVRSLFRLCVVILINTIMYVIQSSRPSLSRNNNSFNIIFYKSRFKTRRPLSSEIFPPQTSTTI